MGYYDHASMMKLQLGHWHPNHGSPNQRHSRQGVTLHQASLNRARLLTAPARGWQVMGCGRGSDSAFQASKQNNKLILRERLGR